MKLNPVETAPTDGTVLLLLVNFGCYPFNDDENTGVTIGFNNSSNTLEPDDWHIVGWNWDSDAFQTAIDAKVLGWYRPLEDVKNIC